MIPSTINFDKHKITKYATLIAISDYKSIGENDDQMDSMFSNDTLCWKH